MQYLSADIKKRHEDARQFVSDILANALSAGRGRGRLAH